MSDARHRSRSTAGRDRARDRTSSGVPQDLRLRGRKRSRRGRRSPAGAWILSIVALVVVFAGAGFALARFAPASNAARAATSALVLPGTGGATTTSRSTTTTAGGSQPLPAPTPCFASFRGVRLHLPIAASAVTVIGFHQSSYDDALPMKPIVRVADAPHRAAIIAAERARKMRWSPPPAAPASADENGQGVWTGTVLEMWRAASTKMFTAVDCGAKYGTTVVPPVSGTIMEIRPYLLYGKYHDFEIHIKPDDIPAVDVIMLHVTDVSATLGEHVVGGVTPIAKVRRLTGLVPGLQLAAYTLEGGDHTHFQINFIPDPRATWVLGKDPPGMVRHNTD